jgi:hypothetical protein
LFIALIQSRNHIKTGKKQINIDIAILEIIPIQNRIINKGAIVIIGII